MLCFWIYAYYRFTEDYVRTLIDMMSVDYGLREVWDEETEEVSMFDFADNDREDFSMSVDIGSAAYWSELMQVQTMDNLFKMGVISDVVTYLEGIPEQYLKNKSKILAKLRADAEAAQTPAANMPLQAQPMQMTPPVGNLAPMM